MRQIKKIKICFVQVHTYSMFNSLSEANIGGTELQLYLLSKELAKDRRFDVSFIVGDWGQKEFEVYDGVKVHRSFSLKKRFFNYVKAPIILWRVLGDVKADIYICSAAGPEHVIVAIFSKIFKKKMIYRVALDDDVVKKQKALNFGYGILFRYAVRLADIIVCQNNDQLSRLLENYNCQKCVVIRNIAPVVKRKDDRESKDKSIILWVGRGVALKRPHLFLELAKNFPKEEFVMIMPPRDIHLFKSIEKEARQISNLRLLGQVSFEKTEEYFAKAKIFVNTSFLEGFPNTFLQAANSQIPILSSNINPDSFLDSYKCGFCAAGNYEKFLSFFRILTQDNALRKKMGETAFLYIRENHDDVKIVKSWKEIFIK